MAMRYEPSNMADRRSACSNCTFPFEGHRQAASPEFDMDAWYCPDPRSRSIEEATAAVRRAGPGAFAARGNLQRLMDHRPGTCSPMCEACDALLASSR